jgi:hypothetical protein
MHQCTRKKGCTKTAFFRKPTCSRCENEDSTSTVCLAVQVFLTPLQRLILLHLLIILRVAVTQVQVVTIRAVAVISAVVARAQVGITLRQVQIVVVLMTLAAQAIRAVHQVVAIGNCLKTCRLKRQP